MPPSAPASYRNGAPSHQAHASEASDLDGGDLGARVGGSFSSKNLTGAGRHRAHQASIGDITDLRPLSPDEDEEFEDAESTVSSPAKAPEANAKPEPRIEPRPEPRIESIKEEEAADMASVPPQSPSQPRSHAHQHSVQSVQTGISEWSHQALAPQEEAKELEDELEWQEMPAYAPFKIFNDDGKLIADEREESDVEEPGYGKFAGRGYTRVEIDEDAQSATSLDDHTAYLFKESTNRLDDDEEGRDAVAQMQATKDLLTPNERIAYVGLVRLAMAEMLKEVKSIERTKRVRKELDVAVESMKMWTQKMMVRLYSHMELESAEQLMIEQLTEHGLQPGDLTPTLKHNSRVDNPVTHNAHSQPEVHASAEGDGNKQGPGGTDAPKTEQSSPQAKEAADDSSAPPPPYSEKDSNQAPELVKTEDLPQTNQIVIDIRWTILCDLFLILIADSVYDARSRDLLERVGSFLDVPWLEICRFEKRVTDALEMQQDQQSENFNEDEYIELRKKEARKKRLMYMGLATVGGGLVIGLSAGLLAPVIGAGLAAGLTTIGISGTGTVLGSTAASAVIGTGFASAGARIGYNSAARRAGAVKTFEYRPLHNNKRVNLIITVAGWMNGKVDDVRLPFSTVNPIMGDMFSVLWEPEMLKSMGETINILATEALVNGLQQILGATILTALMAAVQLPLVLTKLAYLIDNPWAVSCTRADAAGLILADSIINRNLGTRPVTLVGFSLGSRVIYSCLRELSKKGAVGLVQNVYMFGSPVVVKQDDLLRIRTIIAGRFVNAYATNDWILAYLFRATTGGPMRVAGLAPVDLPGIENFDVSKLVPGHMSYRVSMPRCLKEVGWAVESEEFSEIEDPDPDNHESRQRQLIDEIEEARKELEKGGPKKRFGLFGSGKAAKKKNWEMYDERSNQPREPLPEDPNGPGVLFDVEALRAEALELATTGIEIKQLESTLPPMKLTAADLETPSRGVTPRPSSVMVRDAKSFDATNAPANGIRPALGTSKSFAAGGDHAEAGNEDIHLSFDQGDIGGAAASPLDPGMKKMNLGVGRDDDDDDDDDDGDRDDKPAAGATHENRNPWDDDEFGEDFGKEKDLEMTFE